MSLHYYNRLENGNLREAQVLKENTFEALTPFYQYVDTAIRSLRRREDIRHPFTHIYFLIKCYTKQCVNYTWQIGVFYVVHI